MTTSSSVSTPLTLGVRANWQQFALLVLVNAFVGGMVGLERTVVPLLAEEDFGLASRAAALSFLVSFGAVKAVANLAAGRLGDRWGRKPVLITGWLFGLPVPLLLMYAPTWDWVVFANLLLGLNQGLCWSSTVIMKTDLAGPRQRGVATGVNEFAGYAAVSLAVATTGYLAYAYGLRPVPFYPGVGLAVLGLLVSLLFVKETRHHVQHEAGRAAEAEQPPLRFAEVLARASWKDRSLFAASQAGLVNNLNDGMMWGLMPIFLVAAGLSVPQASVIAAVYPGVWGVSQLVTGPLSDRIGRKRLIVAGLLVQAVGIAAFAAVRGYGWWIAAAVLLGLGTAAVYPTLIAAVSDVAHPSWRASAVGVYRLWRDGGYVAGALIAGVVADAFGLEAAIVVVGAITALSGVIVAVAMRETLVRR